MPLSRRPHTQPTPRSRTILQTLESTLTPTSHITLLHIQNPRTEYIQQLRKEVKGRIFIGKWKILKRALGKIGEVVKGNEECVVVGEERFNESILKDHVHKTYARPGSKAPITFTIPAGNIDMQPTQEPQLRKLGIPTTLKNGNIHVLHEHKVCKKGDVLTVQQAHILKLLGIRESEFRATIIARSFQDKLERFDTSDNEEEDDEELR